MVHQPRLARQPGECGACCVSAQRPCHEAEVRSCGATWVRVRQGEVWHTGRQYGRQHPQAPRRVPSPHAGSLRPSPFNYHRCAMSLAVAT